MMRKCCMAWKSLPQNSALPFRPSSDSRHSIWLMPPDWSSGWQEKLLAAVQTLQNAIDLLTTSAAGYLARLGLKTQASHHKMRSRRSKPCISSAEEPQPRHHDLFDPDFARCADALVQLARSVNAYRAAEGGLSVPFGQTAIRDLTPDALDLQWREANASLWPMSMLRKRTIQKLLQSYADQGTDPRPDQDLPLLRRMKTCLAEIDENLLRGKPLPVDGLSTDITAVDEILGLARELRGSLRILGRGPEEIECVLSSILPCLRGTGEIDEVGRAGDRLIAAKKDFETACQNFSEVSGRDVSQWARMGVPSRL